MTEGCSTVSLQNYDMTTIKILQLTLLESVMVDTVNSLKITQQIVQVWH